MKKLMILLSILFLSKDNINKEYCDIKGEVNKPGVYEIEEDYTINDVIKKAGGLKKDAVTNNINLSKKVEDEMVIYIFSKDELKINKCKCTIIYKYKCDVNPDITTKEEIKTTTSTLPKTTTTKKITTTKKNITNITSKKTTTTKKVNEFNSMEIKIVNINTASIEELMTLKGIGNAKAKNIIEYRKTNGNFKSIEDLLKVNGIGEKIFKEIKDFIKV